MSLVVGFALGSICTMGIIAGLVVWSAAYISAMISAMDPQDEKEVYPAEGTIFQPAGPIERRQNGKDCGG